MKVISLLEKPCRIDVSRPLLLGIAANDEHMVLHTVTHQHTVQHQYDLSSHLERVMSQMSQSLPATAPTLMVLWRHQSAHMSGDWPQSRDRMACWVTRS